MSDLEPMREIRYLNGWWDFQPVPHPDLTVPLEPTAVPEKGWHEAAYLVPGFFTDHPYPPSWRQVRSGWARTHFTLDPLDPDRRLILMIAAAIPRAHIFVNGRRVAIQEDMFIGEPLDITMYVHEGENELAVLLTEFRTFPHPETGTISLVDVPWGCCIAHEQAGIWQDVTLEWRPAVHLADVTIRTSVRDGILTVITRVANGGETPFVGTVRHVVYDVDRVVLTLDEAPVTLDPKGADEVVQTVAWPDPHLWSSEDPHLYKLRSELLAGELGIDAVTQRFGYREVRIDGHRILLNGRPQRWYGEWAHKSHIHWLRPEYVRQWFAQLRDLNMNYVRMHTFPHPSYFLDIADEMGILVCQETALHGSGQWGLETPELWPHARSHVRRMVHRDKNHPSLVLWSVENEMRWALNLMPGAKEELPRLRALFNELDPTRLAYHEGDSAIWNEQEQAIISRHYGPACHGLGWWDKTRPLHAGEMGRWHYASPYVALQWAGDEVWTDYALLSQSLGQDAARIIELGRANEVSCLFVWNTSGLDNWRPAESKVFHWSDPQSSYAKPLAHRAYEAEYAWWEETQEGAKGSEKHHHAKGYRPGPSFELIRQALRPVAIVIREERAQFYMDRPIPHTVYVVNDLPREVKGALRLVLKDGKETLWQTNKKISVPSGGTTMVALQVPADKGRPGKATLITTFHYGEGDDQVRRSVVFSAPEERDVDLGLPFSVGVLGESPKRSSSIVPWLSRHGIKPLRLPFGKDGIMLGSGVPGNPRAIDGLDIEDVPLVIVGEDTVIPSTNQNQRLRSYLQAGGRVLVLQQTHSLFPGLEIAHQPTEVAHIRDTRHPIVQGVSSKELAFFADDPYGLPSSDSWVTLNPYIKPTDASVVRPIIDSSGGDFGTGGLTWTPMIEAQIGPGVLIATQLRLADRLDELPVANKLLCNVVRYLAAGLGERKPSGKGRGSRKKIALRSDALGSSIPRLGVDAEMAGRLKTSELTAHLPLQEVTGSAMPSAGVTLVSGEVIPQQKPEAWAQYLGAGGRVVLWGLTATSLTYWEQVTGHRIDLIRPRHAVYQLVRAEEGDDEEGLPGAELPWLAAISHEELCWLDNWTYRSVNRKERIVDQLVAVEDSTPLLTNATRSGLDVLYGDDQATEWRRMPALSAYFDKRPPRVAGGLVDIPVGKGHLLLCMIRWRPELWQFRRFLGLFLWNLGLPVGSDILSGSGSGTGALAPTGGRVSEGYPQRMLATRDDGRALAELVSLSFRTVEYFSDNMTFRAWRGWEEVETSNGRLGADTVSGQGPLLVGFQVHSPTARKAMRTLGGLPNPALQTILRITGQGHVRLWVNGREVGSYDLAAAQATRIPDIDLEAGANPVLLRWAPTAKSSLGLSFENRDQEPEVTFAFS